jgi:hypothetical protein
MPVLKPPLDEALLLLGFALVLRIHRVQLATAGDLRRPLELREGLDLDRVDVGQVLVELFVEVVGHTWPLPGRLGA